MLEEVSDLCKINVESRDGGQTAVHHGCLGGDDPEGGEAAEVWVAFVQEPEWAGEWTWMKQITRKDTAS